MKALSSTLTSFLGLAVLEIDTEVLPKASNICENEAQRNDFIDLFTANVRPFEVLKWNSSIEMADEYAAFYHNNDSVLQSTENEASLCRCTHPSTFGKYREYEHHHKYRDIVCYKTLSCDSGLLCLDWRDICDGEHQCTNGWDEENCDKLEFNECEEEEFRCDNGMCVPEEYWMDGK